MSNNRHKYRVWDGEKKAYAHEGYVVTQLGLVGTYDPFVGLIRNINCTVEQCTGLTDKNGKLIYEGDVLQAPGQTIAYKVQWAHHGFVVKTGFSSAKSYPMSNCEMFEVISNIHEMEQSK